MARKRRTPPAGKPGDVYETRYIEVDSAGGWNFTTSRLDDLRDTRNRHVTLQNELVANGRKGSRPYGPYWYGYLRKPGARRYSMGAPLSTAGKLVSAYGGRADLDPEADLDDVERAEVVVERILAKLRALGAFG